ncbi:SH3 domain-containing protein [Trichothermofontia sp.]
MVDRPEIRYTRRTDDRSLPIPLPMLANLLKFSLGIGLAIAFLILGSVATARYLVAQFTAPPPKPIYPEENKSPVPLVKAPNPILATPPSPSPDPLPPGAYKARVTWSEGLILRDGASAQANTIGGVEFNEAVIVLSESPDGMWQRIKVEATQQEGWVKAGNTERQ